MLQLKTQRVKSIKESYIRINTRELNRVLSTKLSILHILEY